MNKKFSTLVATLLLSGALFTLNATPVGDLSNVPGIEVVAATATTPKTIKLTADVNLADKEYIKITEKDVVIDGQGKYSLNGHIVITGEDCTVKGLKIIFKNVYADEFDHTGVTGDGTSPINRGAIVIKANSGTITGNTITSTAINENRVADGIILLPTAKDAKYTIEGNTIKADKVAKDGTGSIAIAVWENLELLGDKATKEVELDAPLTFGTNTVTGSAVDYQYAKYEGYSSSVADFGMPVKEAVVTPNESNAAALQDIVKRGNADSDIEYKGTAEQLAAALGNVTTNVVINTNDGVVVSGVKQLDPTIKGYELVANISDKNSYETTEYYLLVIRGDKGSYAITADENGKPTCVDVNSLTAAQAADTKNLWKMSQTLDKDGDYTFIFTNKAGKKLTVGEKDFFQSVANAPYGYGVAFELNGVNLADPNATAHYFGLYRLASHNISAEDMNSLQNGAFYVSFPGVEGTDAFAGLLTAVPNSSTTEFKLKNVDGKYIIATAKNVEGKNVNQYVYAFELTTDATKANNFKFFHTPSAAIEDHLMIDKIDSIQVEVPTATANVKGWATLGTYKLTTDGTVTLGASIETELTPVGISLNNNVVDPAKLLKEAGYAIIKQLNDEGAEDDLLVVATGCNENKITLAESVANDLEKQWAISYDVEKETYKMVNRENTNAKVENIAWTKLRENPEDGEGYDKDNIYVYEGKKYEITFVPVDESKDYYKYLSSTKDELKDLTFVMSYWSTVFDGYANVSTNKDGVAVIGTNAAQVEFKAEAADSVKAETTVSYFKSGKWYHPKYTLKAPIYKFTATSDADDSFGLQGGKYGINAETADPIVIRKADNHFNLITVEEKALEGKIYAGNNDSYMYKANCMYDENKNTMFLVDEKDRPEYRRFGKTIEDGFNDMEGDLNKLKFFRTNDENTFLYENSANKNANNGNGVAKDSLNFLGETNLADKSASAQLPFLVDTAYIRDNTRKPLYMLAVRAGEWEEDEIVVAPCDASNHTHVTVDKEDTDNAWECIHATRKKVHSRKGEYLVTLADSAKVDGKVYNSQALYQGNVRLAFVPATHFENDTLVIESSRFRGTKEAANDTLCFVNKNGEQQMNEATFAFRLVDPATVDEGKAEFYIEAMPTEVNGETKVQYVRIHNSVPVLVTDLDQAAVFDVMAAEEGEEATSNEGIEATGVKVIATDGGVIVKGAEGKNVVITNVLGQTIANTVVTSSEATISAPAGVVVVAVEGEAAVKAIVK